MKTTLQTNKTLFNVIKKNTIEKNMTIDTLINQILEENKEKIKEYTHNKDKAILELLDYKDKLICLDIKEENKDWLKMNNIKIREGVILGIYLYFKDNKMINNNGVVFDTMKKIQGV